MLSKAMADQLDDLAGARLQQKTVLEIRHTLRLFAGIIGKYVCLASLTRDHIRAFFDVARYWPSNATKRPVYSDLSVPEVIKPAKKNQEPEPAVWTRAKHRQRLSVFLVSFDGSGPTGGRPYSHRWWNSPMGKSSGSSHDGF